MRRAFMIVLGLLTSLFASAVIVTEASAALPEFTVTTPFKGTGGPKAFNFEFGGEYECAASGIKGSATASTKLATGTISFTACTAKILGKTETCGNVAKGTINSNQLEGTLGYINTAAKTVGLLLKAKAGLASNLLEYECETSGGSKTKVTTSGSVIGTITPVNTKTKQYTLKLATLGMAGDERFLNNPTKFEGGELNELDTIFGDAAASMTSINGEESFETEKEGEIKA